MASMDYCYWDHTRCRYVSGPDSDTRWSCLFHIAFAAGDIERMKREILDPEYEDYNPLPAGVTVESVERRDDGSYAFVLVAKPDAEDESHPILKIAQHALAPS